MNISIDNITIREMQITDLERVYEIETAAHIDPWTISILKDCLRVSYNCFVLESTNQIIGFAIIQIIACECHILNIAIDPQYQGQGFGKYLLSYIIDFVSQRGADMLFLEVREGNITAQQMYLTFGFNEIGERKNYYKTPKGREDAIMFALDLKSRL